MQQLEAEIVKEQAEKGWRPSGYYTAYYATAGFVLGIFGAMASLLFNVICAPIAGKTPLELIRIYLTFPLGEKALELSSAGPGGYAVGDGVILAIGCCLYLGTGMLLGIPVYLALTRFAGKGGPDSHDSPWQPSFPWRSGRLTFTPFCRGCSRSWSAVTLETGSPTPSSCPGGSRRQPTWFSAGPSPCSTPGVLTLLIDGRKT